MLRKRTYASRKRSYSKSSGYNDGGAVQLSKYSKRKAFEDFYKKGRFLTNLNVPIYRLPSKYGNSANQSLRAKLIYADIGYTLDPGLTRFGASQVFQANSLFDIDTSGVGHQPAGYDQYMALYKTYTVLNATIKCCFTNTSTTSLLYGITVSSESTTTTDCRRYIESGWTTWRNLEPGSQSQLTLTQRCKIGELDQVKEIMDDDSYSGFVNTSPANGTFFIVWCVAEDPNVNPAAQLFSCEIQAEAIFREPIVNTLS